MSGFTNVTLAMDLSMSSPGFAVLATEHNGRTNVPIALETSYVATDAKQTHGARLSAIADEIERLILTYQPDHIVREKAFSRFAGTTMTLNKVVGCSDLIAHVLSEQEVAEIPVTTVKKAVTGVGKADKVEVADAVFRILQIENTAEFYRQTRKGPVLIDDMTDACAVGIAYYKSKGLIA